MSAYPHTFKGIAFTESVFCAKVDVIHMESNIISRSEGFIL